MKLNDALNQFSPSRFARQLASDIRATPPPRKKDQKESLAFKEEWCNYLDGQKLLETEKQTLADVTDPKALLDEFLKTEAGFATNYIQVRMPGSDDLAPIDMDVYQANLMANDAQYVIVKKARRIGLSYTTSMRALVKAHLRDKFDSYFISRNFDEAKEKIRYAQEMYDTIPKHIRKDLASKTTKAQLDFLSKSSKSVSRLISHPQTEPRGREGDIYLDEFSSYLPSEQHNIFVAATHCIVRQGSLWIVSTPRSRGDVFWAIDQAEDGQYVSFKDNKFVIPWWHCRIMVKPGLFAECQEEAPQMPTLDRTYAYGSVRLIKILESTSVEDFQVEMECEYVDDTNSLISDEIILANVFNPNDMSYESELDLGSQHLKHPEMESKLQSLKINQFYTTNLDEFIAASQRGLIGSRFVAGVDPGFRDGCAISILEESVSGLTIMRCQFKLTEVDFFKVEEAVIRLMSNAPVRKIGIDIRDPSGRALASKLKNYLPNGHYKVNEVETDTVSNNDMVIDLKRRLEARLLAIPFDNDLIRDIKKVRRGFTESTGTPTIEVKRDKKHGHGDRYFALVYAMTNLPAFNQGVSRIVTPDYKAAGVPQRSFPDDSKKMLKKTQEIMSGKFGSPKSRLMDFDNIKVHGILDIPHKLY